MPIGNEKVKCYNKDNKTRMVFKELALDSDWMQRHGFVLAEVEQPPIGEDLVEKTQIVKEKVLKTSTKKK